MENKSQQPMDLTFRLLVEITNDFSEEHKVGSGGYGDVYKGAHNGEEIAVKKLHPLPGLNDVKFNNEFNNLMRVQHQNIVRLVGYCYEIRHRHVEHNGEYVFAKMEERALCFEYLHGGSLDKHLSDESRGHDWGTRYKIIKGICEGLNHLHNGYKDHIYHLDLKPANILLDKNMIPKIADFGLSMLFGENFAGTPGYMPPEYIDKRQISGKFDVFSLGVTIIQIMAGPTGLSKSAHMPSKYFIGLVIRNWKNRLHGSSSYTSQQVKTCIEIALRCVETNQVKRPTIAEIINGLNELDAAKSTLIGQVFNNTMNKSQQTSVTPKGFTLRLLEQITNHFSEKNKIGSGGYGAVYKGIHNGEEIAVKKLYGFPVTVEEQFKNEFYTLMRVKHQNIVRLIGFCFEIKHELFEQNGRHILATVEERVLCLEYLKRGSLEKYLSDESCGLDWHIRYKIINGICEGLDYLHNGSKDHIYHLDLKPANILLDENMMPKIGDFGISRILSSTQTYTTKTFIGTRPYMPPEYILTGQISKKYDVFSLGVMIIQIMAGRDSYSNYADMSSSQQFIELVQKNWSERIEATSMYAEVDCQQVRRCIEIALDCVETDKDNRPTIRDIIQELKLAGTVIDETA